MHRAATWLAGQGIDQFLDIGTGIPTAPNLAPDRPADVPTAKVVYTDNDPIVLRHRRRGTAGQPRRRGHDYIQADVRQPERIVEHARTSWTSAARSPSR